MYHRKPPEFEAGSGGVQLQDITRQASRLPDFEAHELVLLASDPARGFQAIIAIHDTTLGPALGGTRLWPYPTRNAAITDALRLSRGMTLKAAIAGVPFGGGKAVLIADARRDKTPELLDAYADTLRALRGRFLTGEDVGLSLADADYLRARTDNVVGTTLGGSGNPSPVTARGVYLGLRAAVRHRLLRDDLAGIVVAVQGLGSVGGALCNRLHVAGARLVVSDIDPARAAAIVSTCQARALPPEEILAAEADVLAPCALGAVLSKETIPLLKARVVAGSANNQLAHHDDAALMQRRGILYAPDYVINAGGLLNVASEAMPGGYDRAQVQANLERIPEVLGEIFRQADATGLPTDTVAQQLAEARLHEARGISGARSQR